MAAHNDINVANTSCNDWQYVSEGGATIVFGYNGPDHPIFTGKVLSLRKIAINHKPCVQISDRNHDGVHLERSAIAFQSRVVSKLMAPKYLPRLQTVHVEKPWLQALRNSSDQVRPDSRRLADTLDIDNNSAVLTTNLVRSRGLVVEIKPKWGFLSNPSHLSPETRKIKTRRCRYCIHSYYKALLGETAAIGYCPLDLYSGSEERVARALRNLWKAWMNTSGSINNIKLFANGKILTPNDVASALPPLLAHHNPSLDLKNLDNEQLMEEFVRVLLPLLVKDPLLRILSRLQRTLDPLDIEGLLSLHRINQECLIKDSFPDPSIEEWEHFVGSYLDPTFQASLDHQKPIPENLRYYTMAYLLSATFKDCSIILRLDDEATFDNISVIDVGQKSMRRLNDWAELDQKITKAFVDDGRICIDNNTIESKPYTGLNG